MSCFLIADSVLRVEMFTFIARGEFSPEFNFPDNISFGRRDVSVEVKPDFLALFKKDQKLNKNK